MQRVAASTAVTWEDTPRRASTAERTAQIASLTGLRGFASLMVVLVHVSGLTAYAWFGIPSYGPVSLFVLSGYLLYRPWSRWTLQTADRPSVATFTRRRLARIFPAYALVFFSTVVVYPPSRPTTADEWLHMVTLTWIYEQAHLPAEFVQTWSLATELSWYVALPVMGGLTALMVRSRPRRIGFWLAVGMISLALPISVAWRIWVSTRDATNLVPYSLWLPGFLACFAGGALVAHLAEGYRNGIVSLRWLRRVVDDRWAPLVFALAFALLGTSALGGPPGFPDTFGQEQVRLVCATLIAVTLLAVAVLGGPETPLNRVLSTVWATAMGRWSYGIFLWHFPLLVILEDKIDYPTGVAGFVTRVVLVLGLSVPLAAATYAWVERPAIIWSQRARTYVADAETPQRDRADLTAGCAQPTSATSKMSPQAMAPAPTDGPSVSAGE